jgi:hypothetical protein
MREGFGLRSISVVRCVHQMYVQLFSEITVTRITKFEKVTPGVIERRPVYNLMRIWYNTHEDSTGF